jgi:hypothetical protein
MQQDDACCVIERLAALEHDWWNGLAKQLLGTVATTKLAVLKFFTEHYLTRVNLGNMADKIVRVLQEEGVISGSNNRMHRTIVAHKADQYRQMIEAHLRLASPERARRLLHTAHTPYEYLSPDEQDKDREWAWLYLRLALEHDPTKKERE